MHFTAVSTTCKRIPSVIQMRMFAWLFIRKNRKYLPTPVKRGNRCTERGQAPSREQHRALNAAPDSPHRRGASVPAHGAPEHQNLFRFRIGATAAASVSVLAASQPQSQPLERPISAIRGPPSPQLVPGALRPFPPSGTRPALRRREGPTQKGVPAGARAPRRRGTSSKTVSKRTVPAVLMARSAHLTPLPSVRQARPGPALPEPPLPP